MAEGHKPSQEHPCRLCEYGGAWQLTYRLFASSCSIFIWPKKCKVNKLHLPNLLLRYQGLLSSQIEGNNNEF